MQFDEIEWDSNKRLSNIEKHGLDFADAIDVLDGPCLIGAAKTVGGEHRSLATGMLDDGNRCEWPTWADAGGRAKFCVL